MFFGSGIGIVAVFLGTQTAASPSLQTNSLVSLDLSKSCLANEVLQPRQRHGSRVPPSTDHERATTIGHSHQEKIVAELISEHHQLDSLHKGPCARDSGFRDRTARTKYSLLLLILLFTHFSYPARVTLIGRPAGLDPKNSLSTGLNASITYYP